MDEHTAALLLVLYIPSAMHCVGIKSFQNCSWCTYCVPFLVLVSQTNIKQKLENTVPAHVKKSIENKKDSVNEPEHVVDNDDFFNFPLIWRKSYKSYWNWLLLSSLIRPQKHLYSKFTEFFHLGIFDFWYGQLTILWPPGLWFGL